MKDTDLRQSLWALNSKPSPEYKALQHLLLALIYELNDAPDFPRHSLIQTVGKMVQQLLDGEETQAAQLLAEMQVALRVNLGDGS